jgi:hypothetical protein
MVEAFTARLRRLGLVSVAVAIEAHACGLRQELSGAKDELRTLRLTLEDAQNAIAGLETATLPQVAAQTLSGWPSDDKAPDTIRAIEIAPPAKTIPCASLDDDEEDEQTA